MGCEGSVVGCEGLGGIESFVAVRARRVGADVARRVRHRLVSSFLFPVARSAVAMALEETARGVGPDVPFSRGPN